MCEMWPCVRRRELSKLKCQLLPHLAQITTVLLRRACGGRESLLERSWAEGKREKNGVRHKTCEKESVISCKVRLQGENKMRSSHFNLQSFGSKTKTTDHTALTTCPKLQFTFHFLDKYTQHRLKQILFLSSYFYVNILYFYEGRTGNVFSLILCCLRLLQLVSALYPVGRWPSVFVWPIRLLLEGSCDFHLGSTCLWTPCVCVSELTRIHVFNVYAHPHTDDKVKTDSPRGRVTDEHADKLVVFVAAVKHKGL